MDDRKLATKMCATGSHFYFTLRSPYVQVALPGNKVHLRNEA